MPKRRRLSAPESKRRFQPADIFLVDSHSTSDEELLHWFGSLERAREAWFYFRKGVVANCERLAKSFGHPIEWELPWTFYRFERPELLSEHIEVQQLLEELHDAKSEQQSAEMWLPVSKRVEYYRSMRMEEYAQRVLREEPDLIAEAQRAAARVAALQAKLDAVGAKLTTGRPIL